MTTIKSTLILAAALASIFAAPASARYDADEGALSAYAQFGREHMQSRTTLVNRPTNWR